MEGRNAGGIGMEGQRDGETEGWRDRGSEGWRDRGLEGQRDRGTECKPWQEKRETQMEVSLGLQKTCKLVKELELISVIMMKFSGKVTKS